MPRAIQVFYKVYHKSRLHMKSKAKCNRIIYFGYTLGASLME